MVFQKMFCGGGGWGGSYRYPLSRTPNTVMSDPTHSMCMCFFPIQLCQMPKNLVARYFYKIVQPSFPSITQKSNMLIGPLITTPRNFVFWGLNRFV